MKSRKRHRHQRRHRRRSRQRHPIRRNREARPGSGATINRPIPSWVSSFAYHWHLICISLAFHWHFIGISLAFHWHFISISFAFHLHLTHRMNPHVCLAQFRNCRNPPFQYLFVRLICLIFVRTGNAAMRLPAASNGKRRRLGFCPSIVFQWRRGTRSSLHASFPHPRRYFIGID